MTTTEPTKIPARDVQPGDKIRHPSGTVLTVSRIEDSFFGREGMLAFIEDEPDRWLKAPCQSDAEVELLERS
jgi:hypothetical protein